MLNIEGLDVSASSSLRWKVPYLESLVNQSVESYAFISISETWLKPHITDAQLHLESYNLYRSDRCNRERGGCCLYIQEKYSVADHFKYDDDFCEVIGCSIDRSKTWLFSVYRPGNTPHSKFNDALEFIQSCIDTKDDSWTIIITGDFNFPNICWETLNVVSGSDTTSACRQCADKLLQFMESNLLTQIVDKPTRLDSNGTANILELIITNNEDLMREVEILPTLLSDHHLMSIILSDYFKESTQQKKQHSKNPPIPNKSSFHSLNFHKANFDKINEDLEKVNWESIKAGTSNNMFPEVFYETVLSICRKHTPLKKPSYKPKKTKYYKACYAINRKRRKIKARLKALQQFQPQSRTITSLHRKLMALEKEAGNKIIEFKQREEQKVLEAMRKNPRFFYSYAKKRNISKCRIGPLQTSISGKTTFYDDAKSMADILQKQFISVFSNPENINISEVNLKSHDGNTNTLDDVDFDVNDFIKAIDEIQTNSQSGDEGFPAIVLKKCKFNLVNPLLMLWKDSFNSGHIHTMFLHQLVTPLYKGKGSKCQAVNYRPISLTSHIIKMFERVLRDKIVNFLEENCILNQNQHGFRKGRSCLSELLAHYEEIMRNANTGEGTDTIYLDFAKAFDKVDHKLLLKKLTSVGIKGKLLNWLKAFLSNRKQEVVIDSVKSFVWAVLSGVPQGSVLGPILFLIFINDIGNSVLNAKLKSFADDTKLSCTISCQADSEKLQDDLNRVMEWSAINNMALNEEKFEFLKHHYNFDPTILELPFGHYNSCYKTMNSTLIECRNTVKDLGVTFSSDSTFKAHIASIVKKAKSKAAWILSVFQTRRRLEMMEFYKTYVRPHLEYCCPLWNPSGPGSLTSIKMLEGVQRTFTSKISSLVNQNYWQRLKSLNLMSLQRRRERYIIIYMWKILNGETPNDLNISFHMNERRSVKAFVPNIPPQRINLSSYDKSFSVLGPKLWNVLPSDCSLILHSLEKFKQSLDTFLLQFPDLPPTNGYFSPNCNSLLDWAS